MKKNLLFNNKNVLAFALFFAAFTAQADDVIETNQITENNVETTEILSVMTNIDGQNVTIDALVISLENTKKILNAGQVEQLITVFHETTSRGDVTVDGILFTMNEITYFVKASEFIHETTKVNIEENSVNTDNFDVTNNFDNSTKEVDSQE